MSENEQRARQLHSVLHSIPALDLEAFTSIVSYELDSLESRVRQECAKTNDLAEAERIIEDIGNTLFKVTEKFKETWVALKVAEKECRRQVRGTDYWQCPVCLHSVEGEGNSLYHDKNCPFAILQSQG